MRLGRRHRATALSLALLAAGVFLIFSARVLLERPEEPLRSCVESPLFADLTFGDARRTYHFAMDRLAEERMDLYEGKTLLQCSRERLDAVIPPGDFASSLSQDLLMSGGSPHLPRTISYLNFEELLTEFWRTYDCHLLAAEADPELLDRMFKEGSEETEILQSSIEATGEDFVEEERIRARHALSRLLFVLRASEEHLPLHASLRCLQRGVTDVRNAIALLSDASQCLPVKLGEPQTSLFLPASR